MKYRLAVLLFAVLFWPAVSHAQEYPRFEIGPMFTVTPTRDGGPMTTGFGGRLVGNFSPRIGLEFQLATYQWMTQNVHRAEADFFHVYICLIAADAAGIDAILARRNAVNSETPVRIPLRWADRESDARVEDKRTERNICAHACR